MNALVLRNKQRLRSIDQRYWREAMTYLCDELLKIDGYDLEITLVSARAMAAINESHLHHSGPTDVITFHYGNEPALHGEILVCVAVAIEQAKEFQTSWQEEALRYCLHGILHLLGYDDLTSPARKEMKRRENSVLKRLLTRFPANPLERN